MLPRLSGRGSFFAFNSLKRIRFISTSLNLLTDTKKLFADTIML